MFEKLFGKSRKNNALAAPSLPSGLPQPYPEAHTNLIYNLLFCDELELFRPKDGASPVDALFRDPPHMKAIEQLAQDPDAESRVRALVYHWLRQHKIAVPAKELFGTIVEVPQPKGLDTLAAFADGRVRYINQTGKMSIFEAAPPEVAVTVQGVIVASRMAINHIGPWDRPRLPTPKAAGSVRLSFIVSDGLYFGEGALKDISRDPIGGPTLNAAGQLLQAVVATAT